MREGVGKKKSRKGSRRGKWKRKEGADEKNRLSGLCSLSHGKWNQNLVRKRPSQPTTTKD